MLHRSQEETIALRGQIAGGDACPAPMRQVALLFDMADAAYADKAIASASSFDLRDFRKLDEVSWPLSVQVS